MLTYGPPLSSGGYACMVLVCYQCGQRSMRATGAAFFNLPVASASTSLKLDRLQATASGRTARSKELGHQATASRTRIRGTHLRQLGNKPVVGGGLCRRVSEEDPGPQPLRLPAQAPVLLQGPSGGLEVATTAAPERAA